MNGTYFEKTILCLGSYYVSVFHTIALSNVNTFSYLMFALYGAVDMAKKRRSSTRERQHPHIPGAERHTR